MVVSGLSAFANWHFPKPEDSVLDAPCGVLASTTVEL